MSKLEFNDENEFISRTILGKSIKPGMISWLQEKGIVKDERTAHYVLIGVIILSFGIAGIILAGGFSSGGNYDVEPESEYLEVLEDSNLPQNIKKRRENIFNERFQ